MINSELKVLRTYKYQEIMRRCSTVMHFQDGCLLRTADCGGSK